MRLVHFLAFGLTLFLGTIRGFAEPPEVLDSGLSSERVTEKAYREYVRQCIDVLMEFGTDRYGSAHSPLLMNILDVRTRDCPADPAAYDEAFRVTRRGRRGPGGGNLYLDQRTLAAMVALSRMADEPKYETFAMECLKHNIDQLVDERGFLWWGWHRHYDAHRDEKTGHAGNPHEIHIQQIIWPLLWQADREAVVRQIEAIWQWHVIDKKTGEVNRHGDGQRGCDFAMSGGEILRAFAFLHSVTKDKVWLDRTHVVADYYWQRRHPETNLIANRPNAGLDRFDGSHFDTSITGLYCPALVAAYQYTGESKYLDQAVTYLAAFAAHGYDDQAGTFWGSLHLDGTPVPGPRVQEGYAAYEPRGYIDIWGPYVAGYEFPIYTAQAYALAFQVSREPEMRKGAERWAECIRRAWPPRRCDENSWYREYARQWAPLGTYAGYYGRTISFFLQMHAITGDEKHRRFACEVANEAIAKLYYRGLLRGHPGKPYYESIDGVGYLLYALLQLDAAVGGGENPALSFENL